MKKQRSFTLIELLVVLATIGLLSAFVLIATKDIREKARIAKVLQFSTSVHHLLGVDAIGVWNFNDQTAKDVSGNGNDGTVIGASFNSDIRGVGGYSLNLDGNDYVELPSINPTQAITVEVWVKSATSSGYSGVFQFVSKYYAYILGSAGSSGGKNVCFIIYTTAWQYDSCYVVPDPEKWHHFVGVYNSLESTDSKKLYVDGILRGVSNPSGAIASDPGPVHIGHRECCPATDFLTGLVDDVRIYESALSLAQIKKLYAEGAKRKGLVIE